MKKLAACLALLAAPAAGQTEARDVAVQTVLLRNAFNPFGAGARGLGMGGAFIAVADDGTASTFNPAGLAQLRTSELAVVGSGTDFNSTTRITRFSGGTETLPAVDLSHGSLDFVGLAVPFTAGSRNFTIQLSYQRTLDLFAEGRTDAEGFARAGDLGLSPPDLAALGLDPDVIVGVATSIEPRQRGAFHNASLALGVQATSRLSLGASLNLWLGEWRATGTTRGALVLFDEGSVFDVGGFDTDFDQDQSLRGLNVNLGLLLKYPRVSVGAVARLPFSGDYRLDETLLRVQSGGGVEETDTIQTRVTSRLDWPRSVGAGIAVRPRRGLTVAAEATTFKWSRLVLRDIPAGALLTAASPGASPSFSDIGFFDVLPAPLTNAEDTWQWRAGAEYLVSLPHLVIPLRAGLFRDRSPVVLDPVVARGRRARGFTVGSGLSFSQVVFDVAFERRTTEGLVGAHFVPSPEGLTVDVAGSPFEEVKVNRVVASLIYRPASGTDPLKRLFRRLFVGEEEEAATP